MFTSYKTSVDVSQSAEGACDSTSFVDVSETQHSGPVSATGICGDESICQPAHSQCWSRRRVRQQ